MDRGVNMIRMARGPRIYTYGWQRSMRYMLSKLRTGKYLSITSMLKPVFFVPVDKIHMAVYMRTCTTANVYPNERLMRVLFLHLAQMCGTQTEEGVSAAEKAVTRGVIHCAIHGVSNQLIRSLIDVRLPSAWPS